MLGLHRQNSKINMAFVDPTISFTFGITVYKAIPEGQQQDDDCLSGDDSDPRPRATEMLGFAKDYRPISGDLGHEGKTVGVPRKQVHQDVADHFARVRPTCQES